MPPTIAPMLVAELLSCPAVAAGPDDAAGDEEVITVDTAPAAVLDDEVSAFEDVVPAAEEAVWSVLGAEDPETEVDAPDDKVD